MPRIKNISCMISTSAGDLEEYIDPDMDESGSNIPTSTVYIKAVAGQAFRITLTAHDRPGALRIIDTLSMRVMLDGIAPDQRDSLVLLDSFPTSETVTGSASHERNGAWKHRDFLFSHMQIDSGEGGGKGKEIEKEKLEQLGEIKVLVRRGRRKEQLARSSELDKNKPQGVKGVSEKVLKGRGITHAVKFSEPEAIQAPALYEVVHWDTHKKPYMIFRFLYRSEGFLKSLGFIPYTPTPSPSPSEDEAESADEDLSREALLAELRRLRKEVNPKIKRERSASPKPTPTRAKRRRGAAETIDLTDD